MNKFDEQDNRDLQTIYQTVRGIVRRQVNLATESTTNANRKWRRKVKELTKLNDALIKELSLYTDVNIEELLKQENPND